MQKKLRTYGEMIMLPTFEERYEYLRVPGKLGVATFGFDRALNQAFYTSREWKLLRNHVIVRDNSCDLAMPDRSIFANVRVHHMNPLSVDDIKDNVDLLLNPDYVVCVSLSTHNAIHFGNKDNLITLPTERRKGDTLLWT